MDAITLGQIADYCKIITAIVAGVGSIAAICGIFMRKYTDPINKTLEDIKESLNKQQQELQSVKNDMQSVKDNVQTLTNRHNEIENKVTNNRTLDALIVKTLRIMLDTSDVGQQALKTELDNYLIDEAVNGD